MDGPKQIGIKWQEVPRERRRRLAVLIGQLIRRHLATAEPEASYERDPAERRLAAVRQGPDPAP
jgi:hypothetical protein